MGRDDQGRQGAPQQFRIWVRGRLNERFSEGLAGVEQEDIPAGTMLYGETLDQSQMHSTLDLLRDLGIEVVRFEMDPPPSLRGEPPTSPETGRTTLRNGTGHDR